jgi:hypothetical protein
MAGEWRQRNELMISVTLNFKIIPLPPFLCHSCPMPILPTLNIQSVSDDQFELIDEAVMRCAYASQNKFGRRCP